MGNQTYCEVEMDPLTLNHINSEEIIDMNQYEVLEPDFTEFGVTPPTHTKSEKQIMKLVPVSSEVKVNTRAMDISNIQEDYFDRKVGREIEIIRRNEPDLGGSVLPSSLTAGASQIGRFSTRVYESNSLIDVCHNWMRNCPYVYQSRDVLKTTEHVTVGGKSVMRMTLPSGKYFDCFYEMRDNRFWPSRWFVVESGDPVNNIALDSSVSVLGVALFVESLLSAFQIYQNRRIKDDKERKYENVKVVAKGSGSVVGSAVGTAIGTVTIPFPILGGIAGSLVGGICGRFGCNKIVKKIYRKERKERKNQRMEEEFRKRVYREMEKEFTSPLVKESSEEEEENVDGSMQIFDSDLKKKFFRELDDWELFDVDDEDIVIAEAREVLSPTCDDDEDCEGDTDDEDDDE